MTAHRTVRTRRGLRAALLLIGLLAVLVPAGAASAAARPGPKCDPTYGCTSTTTTAPPPAIKCGMNLHSGPHGVSVTIGCSGVAPGTQVRVLWGGRQVASGVMLAGLGGVVPVSAGHAQVFDAPAGAESAGQAVSTSHLVYAAPDFAPATYDVVLAGDTFSVPVGPFTLSGSSTASTSGSLAHTGITVLLWLLVALAVVAVGYLLNRANQRRHQH